MSSCDFVTTAHELIGNNMGNILESDGSTASDAENEIDVKVHERTDGDGMESNDRIGTKAVPGSSFNGKSPIGPFVQDELGKPFIPNNAIQIVTQTDKNLALAEPPTAWTVPKSFLIGSTGSSSVESPKVLPPRNQLIPVKPIKKVDAKMTNSSNNAPPTSYTQFANAPVVKQKDPKFIPYEPYKGAVRSMTEDTNGKIHSRRPSSSSSLTSGIEHASRFRLPESRSATNIGGSPRKDPDDSPSHNSRNSTLLKERLKMAEKDISDLQNENARLKRLFVDSMAGPVNPSQTFSDTTNTASPTSAESLDNLADEIEVWRSKFLSTCVLVEQLTKENQDLKDASSKALELFREIKNTTALTPAIFEGITTWAQQHQQRRALSHQDSFNSCDEELIL